MRIINFKDLLVIRFYLYKDLIHSERKKDSILNIFNEVVNVQN